MVMSPASVRHKTLFLSFSSSLHFLFFFLLLEELSSVAKGLVGGEGGGVRRPARDVALFLLEASSKSASGSVSQAGKEQPETDSPENRKIRFHFLVLSFP